MISRRLLLKGSAATAFAAIGCGSREHGESPFSAPEAQAQVSSSLTYLGTNHGFATMGCYIGAENEANWNACVKGLLGFGHQYQAKIYADMSAMAANGMHTFSLPVWYVNHPSKQQKNHWISSYSGAILPQHEANLRQILAWAVSLDFSEIIIRFMAQGFSAPDTWLSWDQAIYDADWSFCQSVKAVVESQLFGSGVHLMYDLGGEAGGRTDGFMLEFAQMRWEDWISLFGNSERYYFSIAAAPGRVGEWYTSLAPIAVPQRLALDIYKGIPGNWSNAKNELLALGVQLENFPKTLWQECFYNDATVGGSSIDYVRYALGLPLDGLTQWPYIRNPVAGAEPAGFWVEAPIEFSEFAGL